MDNFRVYFVLPDYDVPSWGIGMIYNLVALSIELGIDATILKLSRKTSVPNWFESKVTSLSLTNKKTKINPTDLIIVPELLVSHNQIREIHATKIAFVQGGFLISQGLKGATSFQKLGYSRVIAVMPHIKEIINNFWPIKTSIVSPYIMDYFFCKEEELGFHKRKRQILLFPKPGYQQAGYYDYDILISVLRMKLSELNNRISKNENHWKIIELQHKSHKEVAQIMKESYFLVNTNCFESLNATVAEAMAAGCITFCYEAYGGQDYLIDKENSYVFKNNYVYSMILALLNTIENIHTNFNEIELIQKSAYITAHKYVKEKTLDELSSFYSAIGYL